MKMKFIQFNIDRNFWRYLLKNTLLALSSLYILNLLNLIQLRSIINPDSLVLAIIYTFFLLTLLLHDKSNKISRLLQFLFVFSLLIIATSYIKKDIPVISNNNLLLYADHLLIATGLSLLYLNRDVFENEKAKQDKKNYWYKFAFFAVLALYLLVHLSMFRYPGGHPDEFRHILAGKTLVENQNFPILNNHFEEKGYMRGAPMSFLVAGFFFIFGFGTRIAKLVPISLGFVTLLLLNSVSKHLIKSKIIRLLSLLLFVLSSWLIFIHFYIRHYVFLEFSFVFVSFLFIKVIENIKNKRKLILYSSLILTINLVNYFLMYDSTRYIIPFVSLFGLLYLFLFEIKLSDWKNKYIKHFFKLSVFKKFLSISILTAVLILISSLFINYRSIIDLLLKGETNTIPDHYNFNTFFFGIYLFFSIFFIYGFFANIISRKDKKLLFFLIMPPMLLHALSCTSMQIMRGMVYLLPIYFVLSAYGLEKIIQTFKNNKIGRVLILILFTIISFFILKEDKELIFINNQPTFPMEIGYDEFEPLYDYVKDNLDGYILIETAYSNQSGIIYDVITDYRLDLKESQVCTYTMYYDKEDDVCRHYYTDTRAIYDREEWNKLVEENSVCVLLRSYASNFLEDSDIRRIKNNFELKESFVGYDIYCKD